MATAERTAPEKGDWCQVQAEVSAAPLTCAKRREWVCKKLQSFCLDPEKDFLKCSVARDSGFKDSRILAGNLINTPSYQTADSSGNPGKPGGV